VRVGIFGGTFDPPHIGHLIVAQDAALALGLDRILFVPAAQPPHKQERVVSPAGVRAEMLAHAIAGEPRFALERLELERAGASYTIDTLRELRERDPATELTLLVGAGQYREFDTWREPEEIRRLARLAVLARDGRPGPGALERQAATGLPATTELEPGVLSLAVTRVDISSTAIRRRVAAGLSIRYLVPEAVERFILEQRLYVGNGGVPAGYDAAHAEFEDR
jgi:nicotinate-nucleotide adenylyltransferase